MPLILPPPSEQTNDSEREPDGLRPAHTRGEAAARLFVGSFALPMERERAKPLEGRAAAAHVGCCVCCAGLWLAVQYPNFTLFVEYSTQPDQTHLQTFPLFYASSNAHP
jgi:hypothetical protein